VSAALAALIARLRRDRSPLRGLAWSKVEANGQVWLNFRDHNERRWYQQINTSANVPLFTQSYRMLADGNLADLHRVAAGWWDRDEFIYLQGMPVGVTHTDNNNPVPVSYWLSPDMMGTPRRILTRGTSLTQVGRLVMDAWGAAVLLPNNSPNIGGGSIPSQVCGRSAFLEPTNALR
jgi:hypothetical protein